MGGGCLSSKPSCLLVAHCHTGQLGYLSSSVIKLICHLIPSGSLRCRPALTLILNTRTELNYFPSPNVRETLNGRVKNSEGADAALWCQDAGWDISYHKRGGACPMILYLSPGLFYTHPLWMPLLPIFFPVWEASFLSCHR